MNRLLILLLAVVLVIAVFTPAFFAEESVSVISSEADLAGLENSSGRWRLEADITVTAPWQTISLFSGDLDGNGHTIRFAEGIVNDRPMFDILWNGATVRDLTVEGYTCVCGQNMAVGFANVNYGTISGMTFRDLVVTTTGNGCFGIVTHNMGSMETLEIDGSVLSGASAENDCAVCYENQGVISGVLLRNVAVHGRTGEDVPVCRTNSGLILGVSILSGTGALPETSSETLPETSQESRPETTEAIPQTSEEPTTNEPQNAPIPEDTSGPDRTESDQTETAQTEQSRVPEETVERAPSPEQTGTSPATEEEDPSAARGCTCSSGRSFALCIMITVPVILSVPGGRKDRAREE